MTTFEIRECSRGDCRLRISIESGVHRGDYCPRCGAPMDSVGAPYQNAVNPEPCGYSGRPLAVLLDNVRSAFNVGAIFRTADGCGCQHVYLCGITPDPANHHRMEKTALRAQHHIPWSQHPNSLQLAERLKADGWQLAALETGPKSLPIYKFNGEPPDASPIVLVVGSERAGLDPDLLSLCDLVLSLPMMGEKGSLNVAVAFGIAAYWLTFSQTNV